MLKRISIWKSFLAKLTLILNVYLSTQLIIHNNTIIIILLYMLLLNNLISCKILRYLKLICVEITSNLKLLTFKYRYAVFPNFHLKLFQKLIYKIFLNV